MTTNADAGMRKRVLDRVHGDLLGERLRDAAERIRIESYRDIWQWFEDLVAEAHMSAEAALEALGQDRDKVLPVVQARGPAGRVKTMFLALSDVTGVEIEAMCQLAEDLAGVV